MSKFAKKFSFSYLSSSSFFFIPLSRAFFYQFSYIERFHFQTQVKQRRTCVHFFLSVRRLIHAY